MTWSKQLASWILIPLFAVFLAAGCSSSSSEGADTGSGDTGPSPDVVTHVDVETPDGGLTDASIADTTVEDTLDASDLGSDGTAGDTTDTPDSEADAPEVGIDIPIDVDTDLHDIEFQELEDGATVSGSIRIKLAPVDVDEWEEAFVTLFLNDTPIFNDTKLPTELVLDTTEYNDGDYILRASARISVDEEDLESDASLTLTFDNPNVSFYRVFTELLCYQDGDLLVVEVDLGEEGAGLTLAPDFSALDSNYTTGDETILEIDPGYYLIQYDISTGNVVPDGYHNVPISVQDAEGATLEYENLFACLANVPATPVSVAGAIYVDEPPPSSVTQPAKQPRVNAVSGNNYIITGGTAQVAAQTSDPQGPDDVIGLIVAVQGFSGYFQKPLPGGAGTVPLTLRLDPNAGIPGAQQLNLRIAAVDRAGNVSDYLTHRLTTIEVMSGDVQVSVSWDIPVDVDLHAIEPSGEEIYYGHRTSATGGRLDLDSNPACSLDNVNNENISWPTGQSPEGEYIVRVDYWNDCSVTVPVNYTVTIKYCGEVHVFNGAFHPGEDDHGGLGAGVTVATFSNDCGFRAEGYVRFEDRTFNEDGFRARTWRPLRYAVMEVRDANSGQTLKTTTTDRFGYYNVSFRKPAGADSGYYIVARTLSDPEDGLRDIRVHNHPKFSQVYEYVSEIRYEQPGEIERIDLDIPLESDAGACNIFDVAMDGYDRIRRMTGGELGPLKLYWQTGADTTVTLYCTTERFSRGDCAPEDSLQIQGKDEDRDEYDDCVILREVYRFAESKISATNSPGGDDDGTRGDPRRAWSEGMATFFSCQTRRSPWFVDRNRWGVYRVTNLDTDSSRWSYGTRGGTMNGYVSRHLVAAFLWDLVDDSEDDTVVGNPGAVYDAAFNYLGGDVYVGGRGFPGRDLVDFIDGWFFFEHGQQPGIQSILEERSFPYDFAGPTNGSAEE